MGTINTSMQAVQKAQIDLGEVDNLPPLGQDMVLYSAHTCIFKKYILKMEKCYSIKLVSGVCVFNPPRRLCGMTVITDLHFASSPQASKVWIQNKMDESKHEIHSQVDAITAGTASVVNLTAGQWHWHMLENSIWILQKKKKN